MLVSDQRMHLFLVPCWPYEVILVLFRWPMAIRSVEVLSVRSSAFINC